MNLAMLFKPLNVVGVCVLSFFINIPLLLACDPDAFADIIGYRAVVKHAKARSTIFDEYRWQPEMIEADGVFTFKQLGVQDMVWPAVKADINVKMKQEFRVQIEEFKINAEGAQVAIHPEKVKVVLENKITIESDAGIVQALPAYFKLTQALSKQDVFSLYELESLNAALRMSVSKILKEQKLKNINIPRSFFTGLETRIESDLNQSNRLFGDGNHILVDIKTVDHRFMVQISLFSRPGRRVGTVGVYFTAKQLEIYSAITREGLATTKLNQIKRDARADAADYKDLETLKSQKAIEGIGDELVTKMRRTYQDREFEPTLFTVPKKDTSPSDLHWYRGLRPLPE